MKQASPWRCLQFLGEIWKVNTPVELHKIYILFCDSFFFLTLHVLKIGFDTAITEAESHAPISDGRLETDVL